MNAGDAGTRPHGDRLAELDKLADRQSGVGANRGRKQLAVLAELLRDDEKPLALIYGTAKNSRKKDVIGVALATNQRLVFYGSLVLNVEQVSYPISNITTARVEKRFTNNELVVTSAGPAIASTFQIRTPLDIGLERVARALNDAIAEDSKPSVASDPIEQLEALGRLRDSGVLTDEEFEEKKAELLKRI
jgi:hypothetical protein